MAVAIKNPAIVLPLALLSHFLVDMIPHWNHKVAKNRNKLVNTAEFFVTLSLTLILAVILDVPTWLLIASMFVAIAPDLMWLPEIWYGQLPAMDGSSIFHRIRRLHQKIQWSETSKGLLVESGWFIFLITLIFQIR